MVIYKITNLVNGKMYIGQTIDFNHRMIAHKSDANNKKSHSYNLPLHNAIRKYGWDNFSKEILEECPKDYTSEESIEWANEREAYYISQYNSLCKGNGYNISAGGGQSPKGKLSLEEKVALSKIFSLEEVIDIQNLLIAGTSKEEIIERYTPKLKESYLDNINSGANFYNSELSYPLFDYLHSGYSVKKTREEQQLIKEELMDGIPYKKIQEKWGLSHALLSLINNGKVWKDSNLEYPLNIRGSSRLHNWATWVKPMINDLENSNLNIKQISEKYNKSYSTIKKINEGASYRDENKKYPLTKNRNK